MLKDKKNVVLEEKERKLLENGWGSYVANGILTQKFFYKSGNEDVRGYLSYPKEFSRKLPIVIWNRGGNDKSGLLDDFLASGILGEIASWGYIVFASQYRKNDEFGGEDVYDILNLINEAKNHDYSDESLIGMEGWSRGGMMSYLTLARTNEIKCCIVVAGLSNLFRNVKVFPKLAEVYKRHFGGDIETGFDEKIKERSAVYWIDRINKNTNILFIHGTADDKISDEDSKEMYEKLSLTNKETKYELRLVEGGGHYLKKERKDIAVIRKKWFAENLKKELS